MDPFTVLVMIGMQVDRCLWKFSAVSSMFTWQISVELLDVQLNSNMLGFLVSKKFLEEDLLWKEVLWDGVWPQKPQKILPCENFPLYGDTSMNLEFKRCTKYPAAQDIFWPTAASLALLCLLYFLSGWRESLRKRLLLAGKEWIEQK